MLTSIRDGGTTHGNVLGFEPMRVMGVLVMLVKKEAYFAQMKNPAPITYLALDSVGEFRLMFVSWASGGYRFYRPGPSLVRCCYTWNNPGPPRR